MTKTQPNKYTIDRTILFPKPGCPGFERTVYRKADDGMWDASIHVEGAGAVRYRANDEVVSTHVAWASKAKFVCQVHAE